MFIPGDSKRRRLPRWLLVLLGLVIVAFGIFIFLNSRNADVHNGGNVEFTPPPPKPVEPVATDWPFFHYNLSHTANLPADLHPPFKHKWIFGGDVLLEFPPIVARGKLFLMRNNGSLYAIDADTGHVRWKLGVGHCAASSPAYSHGVIYATVLAYNARCNARSGNGRVIAVHADTGKKIWRHTLPGRTESSPIVDGGLVYLGSESGTVYALFKRTGSIKWTYKAAGAVKASPALSGGTLYFGDYGGQMNAVWAKTGHKRWTSGTSGSNFGFSSGTFYSTPAVNFGRVYAGNTDSKIYSFGAKTGELAWSHSTGGYVYSAPATASFPKVGPTVYIGSYDGSLYALDARTGATRWTADGGGRISGGVSIVGHVAYASNLDSKSTFGVDGRTGKRVFSFPRGYYNPVVSDGRRIYLTGYASVTALEKRKKRR